MSLSPETLAPLASYTVEYEYRHDRPLRNFATCFVPRQRTQQNSRAVCSLLFCSGLGLQRETCVPVIKRLYHNTSHSRVTIHSVWVIERPNHGDAALANADTLRTHYKTHFGGIQYATAIRAFLSSSILSDIERANMIAIAHSAAGSSLLRALEPATSNLPISRCILVESPPFDREDSWEPIKVLYKAVKASNARRQTSWSSVEEAMRYFQKRPPCKLYHPEVLQIMSETYFCTDPKEPGRVMTKTTVEQETASFLDDGSHLEAFKYLRSITHVLPTHFILGTVEDIWTPELYRQQRANIDRYRDSFASVTIIDGVGHYLPVQLPDVLAAEMTRLLNDHLPETPVPRL